MQTRCLVSHFCDQVLLEKLNCQIQQSQKDFSFFWQLVSHESEISEFKGIFPW